MFVIPSNNYTSLKSYSALDQGQGNSDDIAPCCLDGLFEQQNEIDFNTADELLRNSDAKHSYLSPSTKRLHNELLDASGETNYNEESIVASKKNMIQNINWIMTHVSPLPCCNLAVVYNTAIKKTFVYPFCTK